MSYPNIIINFNRLYTVSSRKAHWYIYIIKFMISSY